MSDSTPQPGFEPLDYDDEDEPRAKLDWTLTIEREQRSVFELKRLFDRQELVVSPAFQRGDVWKPAVRCRLVESVLLRLPLPAVYLAENDGDALEVIDGKQRLTTLFDYMEGTFPLQNLSSSEEFRGKFSTLNKKLQRRIEDFSLNVFILKKGADPDVKYHLFDRLNRGSVALNAMESGRHRTPRQWGLAKKLAGSVQRAIEGRVRCREEFAEVAGASQLPVARRHAAARV